MTLYEVAYQPSLKQSRLQCLSLGTNKTIDLNSTRYELQKAKTPKVSMPKTKQYNLILLDKENFEQHAITSIVTSYIV